MACENFSPCFAVSSSTDLAGVPLFICLFVMGWSSHLPTSSSLDFSLNLLASTLPWGSKGFRGIQPQPSPSPGQGKCRLRVVLTQLMDAQVGIPYKPAKPQDSHPTAFHDSCPQETPGLAFRAGCHSFPGQQVWLGALLFVLGCTWCFQGLK